MRYLLRWMLGALMIAGLAMGAAAQTLEYDSDRLGSDYAFEALSADDPHLCAALCEDDARCVAFTYTPTGFNGWDKPWCWKKDSQPVIVPRTGTVSGFFAARLNGKRDADEVRDEMTEEAVNWCQNSHNAATEEGLRNCYRMSADLDDNIQMCDIQGGEAAAACHEQIGAVTAAECWMMDDPQEQGECYIRNAVEHRSVHGCKAAPEFIRAECMMIVAVERKDAGIVLDDADMPDEERDRIALTYAVMAQDYDALNLIHDDDLYNKALIQLTVNRIGAGKPVDPQACNKLSSPLVDDGYGRLGTNPDSALCRTAVAFAHALNDFAEIATTEQLLEIEHLIDEFAETGDFSVLSRMPAALRKSYQDYRSARSEPYVDNSTATAEIPDYPDMDDLDLATPNDMGGGCLLGQC